MSEEKVTPPAELTKEQTEAVGGGSTDCIAVNMNTVTSQLVKSYEDVVDLTSHVIQRVVGK